MERVKKIDAKDSTQSSYLPKCLNSDSTGKAKQVEK